MHLQISTPICFPTQRLIAISFTASEEENFDLATLIFTRVRYVYADPMGDCIYSSKWFIPRLGQSKRCLDPV